jgi:hypothetical protein
MIRLSPISCRTCPAELASSGSEQVYACAPVTPLDEVSVLCPYLLIHPALRKRTTCGM